MRSSASRLDLFSPSASSPPEPPVAPMHGDVHWVVVTTTRARTACGFVVSVIDFKTRQWLTEAGSPISATHDRYDGTVSCARCLEVA